MHATGRDHLLLHCTVCKGEYLLLKEVVRMKQNAEMGTFFSIELAKTLLSWGSGFSLFPRNVS